MDTTVIPLHLLHRLVGGLASEKVRWAESVEKFKQDEKMLFAPFGCFYVWCVNVMQSVPGCGTAGQKG